MDDLNYIEINKYLFESKQIISQAYRSYFGENKQLSECIYLLNENKLGWNSVQLFVIFSIINDHKVREWIKENRPDLIDESIEHKVNELFLHFNRIGTLAKSRDLIISHPLVNDEGSVHYFDFLEITKNIESFRIHDWKQKIHDWQDFYYTEAYRFLKELFIDDLLTS